MNRLKNKPLPMTLGAAFLATAISPLASADASPFSVQPLSAGYDLVNAGKHEGKCGEGKCGEGKCGGEDGKAKEGKCGEGKCGGEDGKAKEGKCGEGKCGEGKCGGDAKGAEGKCGEGKCGN